MKPDDVALPGKWRSVGLIALAEVLTLSPWFSAAAVLPAPPMRSATQARAARGDEARERQPLGGAGEALQRGR